METPRIKVARGSADYSPADIAGLKKLAADNPNITQLQEFVESKGWERENWNSYQDVIRTDWNTDEVGRLTHLAIELDWNSKDTISQLDLSAFTELRHFECENHSRWTWRPWWNSSASHQNWPTHWPHCWRRPHPENSSEKSC